MGAGVAYASLFGCLKAGFHWTQKGNPLELGLLLVALGIGVTFMANADACARCRTPLQETGTSWPIEQEAAIVEGVQTAEESVDDLLSQFRAGFPPTSASVRSGVIVYFCPECRAVAQLQSCKRKMLPNGKSTEDDISAPIVVTGPAARQVLDAVDARNTAWTKATYDAATYGSRP